MKKKLSLLLPLFLLAKPAYSMHIAEGFLSPKWSILWWLFYLPFFFIGIKKLKNSTKTLERKQLIALVGAFIFVISALKLPSFTGSSSHATGIALGAILLGLGEVYVLGAIVLLFQAFILAHGGFTTLGANAFSMAVVGCTVSYWVYKSIGMKFDRKYAIFFAALLGNLATYICTAFQLAIDHSGGNFPMAFGKFLTLFAVTQIPLGIVEGIITGIIISMIPQELLEDKKEVEIDAK